MSESYWVYITASTVEEARSIASAVVGERLAACANLLGAIESLYWWDGAVQSGNEVALILKTTSDQLEALIKRVKALHSYDCPCIVALPIAGGHPEFLRWIGRECGG